MKYNATVVLLLALLSLAQGCLPAPQEKITLHNSLVECFPDSGQAGSWTITDSLCIYRGKDLYLLLDGGADLFEEYGFLQVGSTVYTDELGVAVTVEVYEMTNPAAAFGIYSLLTVEGGVKIEIGQEATEGEYYIQVWKGRFLVTITARDADRWVKDPARELARAIERRLEGGSRKPDLAEFMSGADSTYQGIVYLRGGLGLANAWTFWYGNIVRLTEGVTGRSGSGNSLIVRYTDGEECARALDSALTELTGPQGFTLVSRADRDVVLHDKQGATVMFVPAGRVLLVAGARSQEEARRCIGELQIRVSRLQ